MSVLFSKPGTAIALHILYWIVIPGWTTGFIGTADDYYAIRVKVNMKIKTLHELEKDQIRKVLKETHWDMQKTARLLQITISQLKRKIQKYEIESD